MVSFNNTGTWPTNWPADLEKFRSQARTLNVGTGIQENIYEIRFKDAQDFERIWPTIRKVKSPNGIVRLSPVIIAPTNNVYSLLTNDRPVVRIYAPSEGYAGGPIEAEQTPNRIKELIAEGKMLKAGPSWPTNIIGPDGALPEYVAIKQVNGRVEWTPVDLASASTNHSIGFLNRARVDLEIVYDGNIIDPRKLNLPPSTTIQSNAPPNLKQ